MSASWGAYEEAEGSEVAEIKVGSDAISETDRSTRECGVTSDRDSQRKSASLPRPGGPRLLDERLGGGAHRYVAAGRFPWVVAGKALNSRVWAFPLCLWCPQKSWHCIIMRWVNLSCSSSRIKRTGYSSSEPWNQLGSFKNQCRDLFQAQWIRVATVEPGILLWSHSLCYSFAAGPSAVCRQVFRSPWTRSFLRSTSTLTSCESCQNACPALLFLGNVIFGWGWKGLEREKGRDTLGRAGRDRCVGQGLKGLRKRFWKGWGQWQCTCRWGPGASGPSHGGRGHDPSPSGSAASGQEKDRLFGRGRGALQHEIWDESGFGSGLCWGPVGDSLSSDPQAQESWKEALVTERYPGQWLERWTQIRWEWILPAGEDFELCSEGDGILRWDQISIL